LDSYSVFFGAEKAAVCVDVDFLFGLFGCHVPDHADVRKEGETEGDDVHKEKSSALVCLVEH
jgi:hypothetical protein